MIGRYNAFIKSSGFEVDANEFVNTWNRSTPNDGATFDGGGTHGGSSFNPRREIFWEAHVVLAPRSPVVIVDASGTITALVNATVRSLDPNTLALSGPLAIGDTIPVGNWISVDDLINSGGGAGSFNANDLGSHDGSTAPLGVIWGNHGLMEIQETWSKVTLQNFSNRTLETHAINVVGAAPVELDIHVDTIPGGVDTPPNDVSLDENTPGTTFEFDIKHLFASTLITISNALPGHVSAPDTNDVVLDGTITNPIGTTLLENEGGNILSGPDNPGKVVRTNILLIDADAGSAGLLASGRAPIAVELVWSQYTDDTGTHERPIVLHADVALDLVLDITSILRETPAGTFSPSLGPIHAGRNIDLAINDSVFGTDIAPIVGTLAVGSSIRRRRRRVNPAGHLQEPLPARHDRRARLNDDVLRAFGNDRTNFDSAYTFTDLSAGNNIHVFHNSTATTITFTAFTDVDATLNDLDNGAPMSTEDHVGRIDLYTNGFIVDTETSSDLRVGSIASTNGDVTLNSPAAVLDAESGAGMLGTDPTPTDVSARNITITAGTGGVRGRRQHSRRLPQSERQCRRRRPWRAERDRHGGRAARSGAQARCRSWLRRTTSAPRRARSASSSPRLSST